MAGPAPGVAALRVALRRTLAELDLTGYRVLVAVSGGADSLALAATAAFEVPRAGGSVGAVLVDHGLQRDSASVIAAAATTCRGLGLDPVVSGRVEVITGGQGLEAAARQARYRALAAAAEDHQAAAVLLAHTQDDQAEQVLLGLARGSGSRSLAGMPRSRPLTPGSQVLVVRPFLTVSAAQTRAACASLGVATWDDPHNTDQRFARVRARGALADLDEALGPGVVAALARSAALIREDADALEEIADTAARDWGEPPWPVDQVARSPAAVRRRLWQRAAIAAGSPPGSVTAEHLYRTDDLIRRWHGQGPIDLPGGVRAHRSGQRMWLSAPSSS